MRGVAALGAALIVILLITALLAAIVIPLLRRIERGPRPRSGPSWRDTVAAAVRKSRARRQEEQERERELAATWVPVSRQSDSDRSWWIGIELVAADGEVLKRSHHTTLPATATTVDVYDVEGAALLWAAQLNEQRATQRGGAQR